MTLVEPMVCSEPSIPREVVEAQLDELDYTLDIIELYPVTIIEDPDSSSDDDNEIVEERHVARLESKMHEEVKQRAIALVVDNARYVASCLLFLKVFLPRRSRTFVQDDNLFLFFLAAGLNSFLGNFVLYVQDMCCY